MIAFGRHANVQYLVHVFLIADAGSVGDRWVEEVFNWPDRGVNNLAGVCAWLCGMAMLISATSFIRRRWYSVSSGLLHHA